MRNIVDEAGEIIAKATDDHTLIGGHHRLAVAASLGQKLFWKDTGEPVKLDPFFKGSSHRQTGSHRWRGRSDARYLIEVGCSHFRLRCSAKIAAARAVHVSQISG